MVEKQKKTKYRFEKLGVDPGIERARAIVRPITVMYSVFVVSVLAIMAMSGYSMPVEGVGANCVNALIGIAGLVTTEYAVERGVIHIIERRKRR